LVSLFYGVPRTLNLNYSHVLILHLQTTLPAVATVTIKRGTTSLGRWNATLTTDTQALKLTLPKGTRIGDVTLVVTVTAAGETATQTVTISAVARWKGHA
jgi:hypothetical protein